MSKTGYENNVVLQYKLPNSYICTTQGRPRLSLQSILYLLTKHYYFFDCLTPKKSYAQKKKYSKQYIFEQDARSEAQYKASFQNFYPIVA